MQETPSPSSEKGEREKRRESSPRQLRRQQGWYLGDGYEYGGGASPQSSDYGEVSTSSRYSGTSSRYSERGANEASSAESLTYRYGRTLRKISE